MKLNVIALGAALIAAPFSSMANSEFSSLSDCEYSKQMLDETMPLFERGSRFIDEDDHKVIAKWRVNTFNPAISEIEDKYRLTPAESISPERELSSLIHSDVVNRSRMFVQETYNRAKNNSDKSQIKHQYQFIKTAIVKYVEQCEKPAPAPQVQQPAPQTKKVAAIVKKSNSGICHDKSSRSYNRTKHYVSYDSVDACLDSGGRLPKK